MFAGVFQASVILRLSEGDLAAARVAIQHWASKPRAAAELRTRATFAPILERASRITILTVAALLILQNGGYNVAGLLAGLGIGGLADRPVAARIAIEARQHDAGQAELFVEGFRDDRAGLRVRLLLEREPEVDTPVVAVVPATVGRIPRTADHDRRRVDRPDAGGRESACGRQPCSSS